MTPEYDYTIYAFDLYFHGQSVWQNREPIEKLDWKVVMEQFIKQEYLNTFQLVGFSMGGKFALATLELFPDKIEKIFLLAPDGIKTSFWYSLATYPIAMRALFKSMILHPTRLYRITKVLRLLRLVDAGLLRFAESQMNTEEKRRRVYYSWVYFRHFKFNLNRIAALINNTKINVGLITGKYDKVITTKKMESFLQKINEKYSEEIAAGHNDLISRVDFKKLVLKS